MPNAVSKQDVAKLVGKQIYAVKKDGTVVEGKLVRINGNQLMVSTRNGKQVKTSAVLPLVLFDLLAIGTSPFAFGGFSPFGFGGFSPFGFGGGFF
ncbi:50S ribosomal protein L33 [Paenibacillus tyrfis]|uniref:50S ribosomal protein L33 n=1 Tax=Paenibacillus tyrfis TaxID=1501230 RepID=UPI000B590358|nr:50S ribosomal protein L33 [Paenibacillus tyrfis]